jgi:hypothetical protein
MTQSPTSKPRQVASWGHFTGFLLITTGIALWGFHTQKAGLGTAPAGQIADHAQAMKTYLIGILSDWALLAYCWAGAAFYGGDLKSLSGGRWRSLKEVWS